MFKENHLYITLLTFLCTFCFVSSYSQNEFTIIAVATDESCPSNGTITLSTENTAPGATINYRVYRLPDLSTVIFDSSSNYVQGLISGTYRIIATQNEPYVTQSTDVIINKTIVQLTYTVESVNAICGNDGSIKIIPLTGTAVSYEIMGGPVTRPVQPSPVFNMIPSGTYQIRVFDNCGEGEVITHTLFSDGPALEVSPGFFPDLELPGCNLITAVNTLSTTNGVNINYPLQIKHTVYPPDGGAPLEYTQTITSGSNETVDISQIIHFYYDQEYHYDLEVIDPCETIYNSGGTVNEKLTVSISFDNAECGEKYMIIIPAKYVGPIDLVFLNSPAGFDPFLSNSDHPGPFNGDINYGNETVSVPFGEYEILITDACGRTATNLANLIPEEIEPIVTTINNDCENELGSAEVMIGDFKIVTANITEAPEAFTQPLPHNVSYGINQEGVLEIHGLPAGNYTLILTDDCGNEYTALVEIPPFQAPVLVSNSRPDCIEGKGTVRVLSSNSYLTSIIIINAPSDFPHPLPHNASYSIREDGTFYMDNLPPGIYRFKTINGCGQEQERTQNVTAYSVTVNSYEVIPHCGSFDLTLNHTSTGMAFVSFWLQKFNPATNNWEHPETGAVFYSENLPDASNSLELTNNSTIYNLEFSGIFRIIKLYETFGNINTSTTKQCIEIIKEFEFTGELKITDIKRINCDTNDVDIEVTATGVPPFTYKITEPYLINNGNNNVFTNLSPGLYKVVVQDHCGLTRNWDFNIANLPPVVAANQPQDIALCDSGNDNVEEFNLESQNSAVLGNQVPENYNITYHISLQDAETGSNPLPQLYTSATTTIYARILFLNDTNCYDITSFDIIVKNTNELNMKATWGICKGENITITADAGYSSYLWSTGATTRSIIVSEPGNYSVTATDSNNCLATKDITVVPSAAPILQTIEVQDWTDNENSIAVITSNTGDFQYSLDGIIYQDENIFYGLATGIYTVYIKDKYDCGSLQEEVVLLNYPKFFTPNGDGINDKWRIKFSHFEPNMIIYIFDRYGKIITSFGPNDEGWDGTYNGRPLPSTDYWFAVTRQDGRILKGHFAMKR